MATPVILPKQGNSVESCIIQGWLKQPGEAVRSGEALCEVETDKAVVEVESPVDGVLIEQFFAADDEVPVQTYIAAVGEAGEDVSEFRPAATAGPAPAAEAAPASDSTPVAPAAAPDPEVTAAAAAAAAGAGAAGVSPRARGLAVERGVDWHGLSGTGPGGMVIERDVAAAAPSATRLSPAAQAAVAGGGLEAPVRGSGPAGLVTVADLLPLGASSAAAAAPAAEGATTEIAVKGIRKVIAERMRASLAGTAQLTLEARARAGALQAYRAQVKQRGADLGLPNITINDLILFAVSRVLPRFPEVNAHFLGDRVVQFADVNIGVAVDTPRGLLVPVLRQANRRTLAGIAAAFKPIATACQEGKADPALLEGGTFTVTNLGALGIDHFTPVLNAPEVAILGVGGLSLQPVRRDGEVVFEDHLALSLTIDHQAIDGAPAARFLQALVTAIEHIDLLLAS